MKQQTLSVVFSSVLIGAILCVGHSAAQNSQTGQKQSPAKKKAADESLTGCIDQQDGNYVLVDSRSMNLISALEADGFPTEGFAKHMGHTVTVRGMANRAGASATFKVRSIETVSDTCAPQQKQE